METLLTDINWAALAPFLVIQAVLTLIALIDWFRTGQTNGPRWMWLLIILFVSILGPVLYFVLGRRQN